MIYYKSALYLRSKCVAVMSGSKRILSRKSDLLEASYVPRMCFINMYLLQRINGW